MQKSLLNRLLAPAALLALLVLAGCASAPKSGGDGAPSSPPADLAATPDAEPRVETIKPGGANKPYEVLGRSYTPQTRDVPISEKGLASWYGRKFHGRRTASGEVYNMYAMTAAHPTMPLPSYARVRNPANGKEVVVRVNDRGPFHPGRVIDLSYTAAVKLGAQRGVAPVEVERITNDEIRSGSWKRAGAADTAVASTPALGAGDAEAAPVALAPPPGSTVRGGTSAEPGRAYTVPARGYWVQLGAFRERDGAENFQQRVGAELDWLAPLMAVFADASLFRLQAGPYPTRDEAQGAAQRVREALSLVPVVVERR
ncbi:septal ring lytic transglycosylase RlpA family protein [Rivibacter subsaxonicus]|uniref:Endolytic peptidoglycan transglycosylase RlpA n=1 Tax=Rivibacter subsaxonicus TaxID=457575 RepID=A0A4Q7VWQ3_9BURK|nr:septal ring lytic transglycosylase RlpA family protein [Rivibacter subsaxonicus]RZU00739.1 rare lipoprotein A [Rivibacter subsaxonicus]